MTTYRLLAIDIDGTLLNSRDEVTPAVRAALARATRAGVHVVLATGRRYSRALHLVEPLGLELPLITASGALVKNPLDHRTLFRAEFHRPSLCKSLAMIHACGYDPLLCSDTFDQGIDFYHACQQARNAQLAEYMDLNPGCGLRLPAMISDPPLDPFAGFVMGTREQMLELDRLLHERLPGRFSTNVLRSPRYSGFICEFAPEGVTKWSAILRLASEWGIDENEICAVGDDVNDIAMIRAARLGVAMGNAQPAVKAAADRIAPTHDEDGLARVVEWLLEGIT
jgi:Cof subfamily protein (haloacid dehalogenase superfamily)